MKIQKQVAAAAVLAAFTLFGICAPARADMGLPMLYVVWPGSWVMLIPVIAIEAWIATRVLRISWWPAIKIAALTNAVTTFLGIPITWVLLVAIEVALGAPVGQMLNRVPWLAHNPARSLSMPAWMWPPDPGDPFWLIPAACLILCVPFFLMSAWCEGRIARFMLNPKQDSAASRWGWQANAASYLLIVLLLVFFLVRSIALHQKL